MKSFAVILLAVIAGAIIGAATMRVDVMLAQAATPDPDVCELVATTGKIDIYYCQPDMGLPFYINSVGFMALEN